MKVFHTENCVQSGSSPPHQLQFLTKTADLVLCSNSHLLFIKKEEVTEKEKKRGVQEKSLNSLSHSPIKQPGR